MRWTAGCEEVGGRSNRSAPANRIYVMDSKGEEKNGCDYLVDYHACGNF